MTSPQRSRDGNADRPRPAGRRPSLSGVLPAYNEEGLIASTAEGVADALAACTEDYEVIVVDDGSRDGTRAAVERLAQSRPQVRCITHPTNRGYGEALRTGLDAAAKELIFFTDGDGQFIPTEIERLLPDIVEGGADMAIGYRAPRVDPPMRLLNAWGWKLAVTVLFGYAARDIDCAFKLMRREVWHRVHVHSGSATFSAELLIKARRCGYRVVERPVTHRPRRAGSATGAKLHVILRAFRDLLWLRLHLDPCPKPEPASH